MFNRTQDPVCGMKVRKDNAVATAEYEGETYYFCATSCKEEFMKDPKEYTTDKKKSNKSTCKDHCCCHD